MKRKPIKYTYLDLYCELHETNTTRICTSNNSSTIGLKLNISLKVDFHTKPKMYIFICTS